MTPITTRPATGTQDTRDVSADPTPRPDGDTNPRDDHSAR